MLALVFAALIGAAATAIAVRWSEPVVAGIGIVGALLAPVLVDAGTDSASLAFMAIALVSAVGVLLWRRWSWLADRGLRRQRAAARRLADDEYDERLGLSLAVLAAFWLALRRRRDRLRATRADGEAAHLSASLLLADAALLAGAGWAMLDDTGHGGAATAWVSALPPSTSAAAFRRTAAG